MPLANPTLAAHVFLEDMIRDSYFPRFLVEKGQRYLQGLCAQVEVTAPDRLQMLELCHAVTEAFNDLEEEFAANDSELETAAREAIARDFALILSVYGYEIDVEDAIAPRNW
jgi:hypothetical protein